MPDLPGFRRFLLQPLAKVLAHQRVRVEISALSRLTISKGGTELGIASKSTTVAAGKMPAFPAPTCPR